MSNNIVFQQPDDPNAANALQQALASLGNLPILGLLIKTDSQEHITNWRFADAEDVKSLALALPGKEKHKE